MRMYLRLGSAVLVIIVLFLPSSGQVAPSASGFPMRTFFSVRSAKPDDNIPAVLRGQFEKDDGGPLRSVAIDLDRDGRDEKFVLCSIPSKAGGYQWLIYDLDSGVGRGVIIGTLIFIGRDADGGHPRLETYWRQGGNMSIVSRYAFAKGRYGRTETRALSLWEASEYFRSKGPIDLERELAEIQ